MYDLLIKNGTVVDGTGAPRFQADVAVKDGKIARIAPEIAEGAETVIDARGLVVAPGFIDTHTHSDGTVFSPETTGYNHLEDGATTELAGQCGSMAAPYYGEFDPSHGSPGKNMRGSVKAILLTLPMWTAFPTVQTWRFLQARDLSAARSWALATELRMRNSWNRCAV